MNTPVRAGDDHRDSLSVRQHGYEHGYRDGYEYGSDVRQRNVALDYRTDAYRDADRGYLPVFGSREQYREGFRDGYRDGAEDGYNGARNRLERVFDSHRERSRDDRDAYAYRDRRWDYQDVAGDIGYREGVNAGLKDRREHHSYCPQEQDDWKDGTRGYNKAFGDKDEYKRAYRSAYEAGYRDGFGLR